MIEDLVLTNLAINEGYSRRVLPFLDPEYFHAKSYKIAFKIIKSHIDKYNELPSRSSLLVDLQNVESISEQDYKETEKLFDGLVKDEDVDEDWLVDTTEKFCQDKAIYTDLMK